MSADETTAAGDQLDATERRRAREAARDARTEAKRERDRIAAAARRAERRAASPSPATPAAPAAAPPALGPADPTFTPARSDDQREADASIFLRGLFRVLGLLLPIFGFELAPLTVAEAREDAAYLVPLARRHIALDQLLTWAGAPVALVERIVTHLRRKPRGPAAAPGGAGVVPLAVVPPPPGPAS